MPNKKLKLVTAAKPEPEKEVAPPPPIKPEKHIFWHVNIAGVDLYSYDTQSILDTVDAAVKFYGTAPIVQISGDCLLNGKPVRVNQETVEYVAGDRWKCLYMDGDIHPLATTFVKVRVAAAKPDMLKRWEESQGRVEYRKKLLDALRIS